MRLMNERAASARNVLTLSSGLSRSSEYRRPRCEPRKSWWGKAARVARLKANGYPCYTTSAGWLGYSNEKLTCLATEAVEAGFNHIKMRVGRDRNESSQHNSRWRLVCLAHSCPIRRRSGLSFESMPSDTWSRGRGSWAAESGKIRTPAGSPAALSSLATAMARTIPTPT